MYERLCVFYTNNLNEEFIDIRCLTHRGETDQARTHTESGTLASRVPNRRGKEIQDCEHSRGNETDDYNFLH